jgi:hypothetical protein
MRAVLTPKSLSQRSAHKRTSRLVWALLAEAPFARMEAEVESVGEEVEQ